MNSCDKSGRKRGAPLVSDTLARVGEVVVLAQFWKHTGIGKSRWYAIAHKYRSLRALDAKRLDRALGRHIREVSKLRREIRDVSRSATE